MFYYLRLFSILSLAFVVGITFFAGESFQNSAIDYIIRLSNNDNISNSQGYMETVWKDDGEVVATITTKTPEELKTDERILHFAQETIGYFKKMPIMRFNLYNSAGALILTGGGNGESGNSIDGNNTSPDLKFVASQFRGNTASNQLISDIKLKNGVTGSILQTIVPIKLSDQNDPNAQTGGALELISDMTYPLERIKSVRLIASLYVIIIFLALLLILSIITKRAEAIISKQHEANIELAATAAAAQSESQDKSQFLANVSHELRTPLNSIIGFSEIIKNNVMEDMGKQKLEDYISDIHSSGVHLLSLINDILDFSKAEAGKLELEVSEVNANKLILNCLRLVQPRAEKAQVKLVEALPKEALNITTDSKKFKQILLNLLSNAIKFTPQGGEVRITAWEVIAEKSYYFEVRDTGIGIAPKDISKAMSPFGQVDSALSRKYEGTGLGLPLTKKFVEIMDGKFTITSEVDVGTTITFSLPKEIKEKEGIVIKQNLS